MTETLLVYPPFCTPASPSYSINYLASFLKNNGQKVKMLDLNLEFHRSKYPEFQQYYQQLTTSQFDKNEYTKKFQKLTGRDYSLNNKLVVQGKNPELLQELLGKIVSEKPTYVAFSIVYSSQAFYALALIKELKKLNIKTIIGGPAVNEKLTKIADHTLNNEVELLETVSGKKVNCETLDCSRVINYDSKQLQNYFVPQPVVPIKTASTCFYQQCAFCTHHGQAKYVEFELQDIKQTIIKSGQKKFFFIDDMISKKRLLQIAELVRPLNISWMCQLRPTKDLDQETLKLLHKSGLDIVIWGVESGCDRVLKLIRKGTNKKDVQKVLSDAHAVGIKNVLYIMFGFPGETEAEFLETIEFLEKNQRNIELVSTSTFGLQHGSLVYQEPEKFGILNIKEEPRTVLEPKITYDVVSGMNSEEIIKLRKKNKSRMGKINKFPKNMNYFREQMLSVI